MEVSSQSPQNPALSGSPQGVSASKGTTAVASDFETFIKMLTVQMQNQDPLNPVEASDFAVQLATFSTVEQQVKTNQLLTTLGSQIGALSVAQLTGWIGMEARAEMPVNFDGAPVTLTTRGATLADRAELVVRNSAGNVVQRQSVDPRKTQIEWAGVGDSGAPLPSGRYNVTVESFSLNEVIATHPVEVHAKIVEARNDNGAPVLVMDSGQEVASSSILGLRAPSNGG